MNYFSLGQAAFVQFLNHHSCYQYETSGKVFSENFKMQDKPLIARNLTVLLGYIFFTGIVHLNSYFLEFGFRISNLNLEYYHILFRGLSVNFTNFYAFFIFLFISISIVLNFDGYRIKVKQAKIKISHIQEFSIIICFILIYVIASLDGFYVAQRDSTLSTTTLREWKHLIICQKHI